MSKLSILAPVSTTGAIFCAIDIHLYLTTMTTNNPATKYLTDRFAATDFSFPFVQALRGEDPKQCGYFVPLSQAEKAGWRNVDPDKLTEYSYNSGKTDVGILLKQPRMALTPICQLGMFDRKASQDEETGSPEFMV